MQVLNKQKILLGITGGIAAYKSAVLLRLLRQAGAEVRVVMTEAAQAFVTPLTFQSLSDAPVHTALFDANQEAAMSHIELARWADVVLVAPASADFMARLALGIANDLLSTLCLATRAPIILAPAMNQQMWLNPATQENLQRLRQHSVVIWGPAEGEQACGETGPGRMLEPEELLENLETFNTAGLLQQVRVLVTAGSTREPIDPVRYIGNRSSGKMGYALAAALVEQGSEVCLISGPVTPSTPPGVERVDVETAAQMHSAVMTRIEDFDIFISVAAVADYRPEAVADHKIKKTTEQMDLVLLRNPDILAEVAAIKQGPFTVGFAAETDQLLAHAKAKLEAKGVDLMAANQVAGDRGGFESEENALVLLWQGGQEALPMMPKPELARCLIERIAEHYHEKTRTGHSD